MKRKKFKCLYQLDAMDCGPTCLQSIALYYGKQIELDYLRSICYITREGVSLLALAKAAEKIGFTTRGVKISLSTLVTDVKLPCILHWRQEHFVVLYKIKNKKGKRIFYISDPSVGNVEIDEESFIRAWVQHSESHQDIGVCLLLEPSNHFEKTKNSSNKLNVASLFGYIKSYKKYYLHLVIGLVLGGCFQIIFPFLTQSIVDKGIGNKDINIIYIILLGFIFFTCCNSIITYIRNSLVLHIGARINISIISDFLNKLLKLPLGFFDKKFMGDIIQRIKDHDRIESFLVRDLLEISFSIISILIFGVILACYNITVFGIFAIGAILYISWILFFVKKRRIIDYKRFIVSSQNQTSVYQLINGIQDIKLNNCETEKRWEWEKIQVKLFKISLSGLKVNQLQTIGASWINEIKNIIIIFYTSYLVINDHLTVGGMMAIQYICSQLNSPIINILDFVHSIQDAKLSLERLGEIHSEESEKDGIVLTSNSAKSSIILKNVSFRYNDPYSKMVLDDISLVIPYGKTTAIVGISGTGKTTLIKLVLGFYSPEIGDIYIGDTNLNDIDISSWRKQCGVVMQDGYIFNDTIANNICINSDELDIDRLHKICKNTNILQFVENLPLKFNTKIGEDGIGLSQGQKQRILIARALYRNPNYIFLDEATNALDSKNEFDIVKNITSFLKGKTMIVIAHRLSTIRNADNIVLINNGEIKEVGTHQELLELRGLYYELVNKQL